MIVVKKKMKRPLIIVILAAILAVLTAAAILLDTFLLVDKPEDTNPPQPPVVDKDIGEDVYLNSGVAYSRVEESHITSIVISSSRKYGFTRRDIDNDPATVDPFVFNYVDNDGNLQWYLPNIMYEDGGFEYDDLYALEQNDGYGTIRKLTYLTTAFGTLYFDNRIELPSDEAERKRELSAFGFGEEDSPITAVIRYNAHDPSKGSSDHAGETEAVHTITVGSRLATNSGYYYMVDDRPYIYTTYSTYMDYAFIEFTEFLNPLLVAAGLPQDNAFEPYLTTDYQQYKNTVYDYEEGKYSHNVVAGSDVIISANVIKPDGTRFLVEGDEKTVHIKGGLKIDTDKDVTINLGKYSTDSILASALIGKPTGKLLTPLVITVPDYSNTAELGLKYRYVIKTVEAILTQDGYNAPAGAAVASDSSVKVSYELHKWSDAKGGYVKASESDAYGIIDISSDKVPASLKNALIGKSVGALTGADFTVDYVYSKENSDVRDYKIVVERIIGISDAEGNLPQNAATGHKVLYRYDVYVNEERVYNDMIGEHTMGGTADDLAKLLNDAFAGKAVGDLRVEYKSKINLEFISAFSTFEIDEIKFFVVKENVVSFKFQQASERDAYYGESIYMNQTAGKYGIYALNSSSCEAVVRILGGLLTNANSSTGLVGTKTVDVGITPEKLKRYGLYDYTIYFELPRGIEAKVYDSSTTTMEQYLTGLDDYEYATTLGFNLYISKPDPATGIRYIASDLYDIIAEIDAGDDFVFLEQNFVDFYARKNTVLVNIENIDSVDLEFMMNDMYGKYHNDVRHQETYALGGGLYLASQLTKEQLAQASKYDSIEVIVTPSGECSATELSSFLAAKGYTFVSLRELYGADKTDRMDSLGTSYFKEFVETLFNTRYQGTLTDEEQANALASHDPMMRMTINIVKTVKSRAYRYTYEFYKISSRRVMVKISQISEAGSVTEVSDFYVSNFAFEKLCNKYFDLLNKKPVSNETVFTK